MKPIVPIELGDVVTLKKGHPCGTNAWEVVRLGMDIGLRCRGCDRKVMLVRSDFDRRYRSHLQRPDAADPIGSDPITESGSSPMAAEDHPEA